MNRLAILTVGLLVTTSVLAGPTKIKPVDVPVNEATGAQKNAKVHYNKNKDVQLEETVVQGQTVRAQATVVTGNVKPGSDSLVRLRENFIDRMSQDAGEEVQ